MKVSAYGFTFFWTKTLFFVVMVALGFTMHDAVVKMLAVNRSLWQPMLLWSLLVVLLIVTCTQCLEKYFCRFAEP